MELCNTFFLEDSTSKETTAVPAPSFRLDLLLEVSAKRWDGLLVNYDTSMSTMAVKPDNVFTEITRKAELEHVVIIRCHVEIWFIMFLHTV